MAAETHFVFGYPLNETLLLPAVAVLDNRGNMESLCPLRDSRAASVLLLVSQACDGDPSQDLAALLIGGSLFYRRSRHGFLCKQFSKRAFCCGFSVPVTMADCCQRVVGCRCKFRLFCCSFSAAKDNKQYFGGKTGGTKGL